MVLNVTRKLLRISESSAEFGLPMSNRQKSHNFTINDCFNVFHSVFTRTFFKIGLIIGKYPSYFIIIPFFISILGLSGFQRIQYERDSEYLFIPTDSKSHSARKTLEEFFPNNSSQLFDPSRISRANYFAKIYIRAKDGGTVFRTKVWDEVILLDKLIKNITVEWDGRGYNYEEMCASWHGKCFYNIIYNLNEIVPGLEDKTNWLSYPINLIPFILPMFLGGVSYNKSTGILESAKAVFSTYWVTKDDWKQRERAHLWEGKLLKFLKETDFDSILVDRYVSRSIPDEIDKNSDEMKGYLPYAILLLFGFGVVSAISLDWVRCKGQMVLMGLLTVMLALCTSFGLLMYVGVPFIGVNMAIPFLMLGIGLDDLFIMLSAWRKTKLQDEVPTRLAETYKTTAISITVTSLTNMCAFVVGTLTNFPGVRIFCIYSGVSIAVTYLWFVTFFGASLAMFAHFERQQRHAIFCWKVSAKSESAKQGACYTLFCAGGISKRDQWNPLDNQPCQASTAFKNCLGTFLNIKGVKGTVLFLYLLYLAGALYGCFHVKQGLDPKSLAVDNSYLSRFYQTENQYFKSYPYRIQVIIKGNISYYDKETKIQLTDLHKAMENLTYIGPRLYSTSWIRSFLIFLHRNPSLRNNITDETSFIETLTTNFLGPLKKESIDVVFNENKTKILASRFILQGYQVRGLEEDKEMVRQLRKIADESPLDVSVYHPTFVYYDQYLVVMKTTVRAIAVAAFVMVVVSFAFIPNPVASLWVGLSILSIQVGVVGYAALWGVRLDTISMINHILSIGYSVDYSAHVVYAYLTSTHTTPEEKLKEALFNVGLPVVQSGLSTILGVVLFALVPSYIYRTFFKVILLVTLSGMAHALIVLPIMLSLTPPGLCKIRVQGEDGGCPEEDFEPKSKFTSHSVEAIRDQNNRVNSNQGEKNDRLSNGREGYETCSKRVIGESLQLSERSLEEEIDKNERRQINSKRMCS